MPSSATITASWYIFTALTVIKSAYVNSNFDIFRGHILAVDPSTGASAVSNSYDLGAVDRRWRKVYGKISPSIVSTTGSMAIVSTTDIALMDSTAATITGSIFTAVGNSGASWSVKNIGTAGKTVFLDANGTEKLDNTVTVNLVDGESATYYAKGGNWWSI